MSDLCIELVNQYEKENMNICNNLIDISQDSLGLSEISKSKFSEPYHIYCTKCKRVQVVNFISKNEVKLICECKGPSKVFQIKDCFKYLYKSNKIDTEDENLKCFFHPDEKYGYYCEICKRNLCSKCVDDDIEHKDKIKIFALDNNTIYKRRYIYDLIKEKNQFYIDNVEFENDDESDVSKYKLVYKKNNNPKDKEGEQNDSMSNDESIDEGKLIMKKVENDINTDETKLQIINIMNDNNNEELDENEYFLMNLLSIILDDSQNYPNFNHIETISNVEKFIILYFKQYNEIKLKYEFKNENINNNTNEIELFGSQFVENNKQKCFLLINKRIMELNRLINLTNIFKKIPEVNPIILDVRLIEKKNQLMSDLSFMFSEISTIREINFNNYDTHNIKSMAHMFNNCSSLTELPDISLLNTTNVTDISYMFNNCSSIKNLPDISKWDTRNVTNMSYMFYNCTSLEILPDISAWNVKKLKNFSYMFGNCKSLTNLSILSAWELKDDSQTETMLQGCELIEAQIRSQRHFNFCDCLSCYSQIFVSVVVIVVNILLNFFC